MTTLFPEIATITWTETVICTLATAAAWAGSFTILLPVLIALILSKSIRNKIFAYLQGNIMSKIKRYHNLVHYRQKLFDMIQEHTSKGGARSTAPLRILEVGVGSGENFQFYPQNHTLTTVDMNPEFETYLRSTLKKYPHIKLENVVTAYAEDMSAIPANEFDVVVATHLLCSVEDVDKVLNEFHRVLKKDGIFACFDHIMFTQRNFLAYLIQNIISPLWRIYFNGCNLNRDILKNINHSRFGKVSCNVYYPDFLDLFFRPHIVAICTK